MQFADQVHRHFLEGGAFYVDPNNPAWDPAHPERNVPAARFARLAAQIEQAIVGESARWGGPLGLIAFTRDVLEGGAKSYAGRLLSAPLGDCARSIAEGRLYPRTDPPRINQSGPEVPAGFLLELSAPAGSIFYTTNGTDPRSHGWI